MATDEWLSAARSYSRMSERERAKYWNGLTLEQQKALRGALPLAASADPAAVSGSAQAAGPPRRGCSSPLAIGCLGMILGSVLTVGVEVAAVMMGVGAIGSLFQGASSGSSSSPGPQAEPSAPCANPEYRSAHLRECDPATWDMENRKAHHPEEFGFPAETPP